eukprot:gene11668-biopygen9248
MDDGNVVLVASLDLAGAFDTLDRQVLSKKLSRTCGTAGAAKELIDEYLSGRQQRVRKRSEKSGWKENPWGVPQGSVLGPLLFALYCADIEDAMEESSPYCTLVQYADDVSLVIAGETIEEARDRMNVALREFADYAAGNMLAAEPEKTQLMVCSTRRRKRQEQPICKMGGHAIEPKETMKVLGVTIDNRLSWEVHNAIAAGRASGIARAVARGTRYLGKAERASLIDR